MGWDGIGMIMGRTARASAGRGKQGSKGRQNHLLHPLTRAPDQSVACRHVPPTKNRTDFGGRATSHEARQAARQGAAVESSLGGNRVASRGISYQVTATNPQRRGGRWNDGAQGPKDSHARKSTHLPRTRHLLLSTDLHRVPASFASFGEQGRNRVVQPRRQSYRRGIRSSRSTFQPFLLLTLHLLDLGL